MIGLVPLRPQPQAWLWRSVLSPFAERYCEYLIERGYAVRTIHHYVRCVAHFAYWLTRRRTAADSIDDRLACCFVNDHLPKCTCPDPTPRSRADMSAALRHLLVVMGRPGRPRYLRTVPDVLRQEVCRFTEYLEEVCGLAEYTRYQRARIARDFLLQYFRGRPIDVAAITIRDIHRFVTRYPGGCKAGAAGVRGRALRSYLRFRATRR